MGDVRTLNKRPFRQAVKVFQWRMAYANRALIANDYRKVLRGLHLAEYLYERAKEEWAPRLRVCPFCGKDPRLLGEGTFSVDCVNDECDVQPGTACYANPASAAGVWNGVQG